MTLRQCCSLLFSSFVWLLISSSFRILLESWSSRSTVGGKVTTPSKWRKWREAQMWRKLVRIKDVSAKKQHWSIIMQAYIPISYQLFFHLNGWNYLSIPKLQQLHHWGWEWIRYSIPHFIMNSITYPVWDWSYTMLLKGHPVSISVPKPTTTTLEWRACIICLLNLLITDVLNAWVL